MVFKPSRTDAALLDDGFDLLEQDKEKSEVEIFTLLFNYVNNGEILKAEELKFITEPQYYILIKMRWVLINKFHKMIG